MACTRCEVARRFLTQFVLNWLLAIDRLANTILLGDPNETLSQRSGRAQRAGARWARWFCRALNVLNENHCEWSLQPGPSIGREILSLSP